MTSEAMVTFLPFPPLPLPPDLPLPSTVGARWALCGRRGFSAKNGGWAVWFPGLYGSTSCAQTPNLGLAQVRQEE